ncbi:MAG: beta-propeller fold lactonase family protein [Bryobacteraceae bacterium]|nr:beta-propeller fold lactonase family protein [Bryobacteraceae bacterium]
MMRFAVILLALSGSLAAQDSILLVLQKGASSLAFYKPNGELQATVPVGRHPHEIVVSRDRRYAYTSDNGTMRIEQPGTGGNTASVIDLKARKRVGEINLGNYRRPHGLALDPEKGILAITTELPDQLLLADVNKRAVIKTFDTKGKTSHMVTLQPGGRMAYVSNSSSGNIAAIDLTNGSVKLIPTGQRPEGSVVSPDGRFLYVANRESHTVSIIDTAKNEVTGTIRTSKGPVRIALTPGGKLVYAAMHDKRVEMADPATRRVLGHAQLDGPPVSLNLSPDGKLAYASVEEMDTVYAVSLPDMTIVRKFQTAKGAGPDPVISIPAQ